MSAYVVDHSVIDRILSTAIAIRVWTPGRADSVQITADNATIVGRMLLAECIQSVTYRYPSMDQKERDGYAANLADYSFVSQIPGTRAMAAKTLCEYDYQSCEHPGWPDSTAHALIRAIGFRLLLDATHAGANALQHPLR